MAKGTVDWYKGIDITYQTLSLLTQRPRYGATTRSYVSGTIPANATTTLIAISGKGMIYGIAALIQSTGIVDNDYATGLIDGTTNNMPTWKQCYDMSLYMPQSTMINVACYDDTNYVFSGMLGAGITFETSFYVQYTETYGRTPTGSFWVFYGLVS